MDFLVNKVIIEPFDRFFNKIIYFLPELFTAILIFIMGLIIAGIARWVIAKFLRFIELDKLTERSGFVELIKKAGIREPVSLLTAKIIKWIIILVFTIVAVISLNIPAVERFFEGFLLYLPNIFVALVIIFLGLLFSNFFGRAALIASVNAGIKSSGFIGRAVKFIIFVFAITMALEQLGIGRGTIIIAFAIVFGGIIFALAIAFGFGGKDMARRYLERRFKEDNGRPVEKDGINHL
jgi:hypothetical protein